MQPWRPDRRAGPRDVLKVAGPAGDWRAMMLGQEVLSKYPKMRGPLPDRHSEVYAAHYKANREGEEVAANLAQRLESWMHRRVASVGAAGPVLEIGAGTLNHLPYEGDNDAYDVVEPFTSLFEGKKELSRVRDVFASQFDIEGRRYKRIISIAVLEHLLDLPREVAKSASLLDENGVFQAAIPSEGGFLWWLGWRCTTGLAYFAKHGLDYGVLMRHEHVSTADEIVAVVEYFFEDVEIEKWPHNSKHLSFYQYIEARNVRKDRVLEQLERNKN
jgi:hypothetical protein